jgi:hypothetical protein
MSFPIPGRIIIRNLFINTRHTLLQTMSQQRELVGDVSHNTNTKPPNVMVYCGKKDTSRLFDGVKAIFQQCLNPDKYATYHLKHDQVAKDPWKENTCLLIISCEKLVDGVDKIFLDYYQCGGKLISFCSSLAALFLSGRSPVEDSDALTQVRYGNLPEFVAYSGKFVYEAHAEANRHILATMGKGNLPAVIRIDNAATDGIAILCQVCV